MANPNPQMSQALKRVRSDGYVCIPENRYRSLLHAKHAADAFVAILGDPTMPRQDKYELLKLTTDYGNKLADLIES